MAASDLVVIGAGPGGYIAAIRAAQLGLSVTLVEKDASLGGTCLNVGCMPSKALLESSELYARLGKEAAAHGIQVGEVGLDLAAMMARKAKVVEELTRGIALLMKKNKVTVLQGLGRLDGPGRVVVTAPDGAEEILEAGSVLLATGSAPVELPFLSFDGAQVVTSTEALSFDAVPESLAVIGAGAVGLEMASVWSRLGATVTVIELLPQITPFADADAAKELLRALKKQGIKFQLGAKVTGATLDDQGVHLAVEDKRGKALEVVAKKVLVAVGRRPYVDGLGLESAGLKTDQRGRIAVDAGFRTAAAGVFAIGDLVEGPMLAHKAEEEGVAVAEILAGKPGLVNHDAIPSVVYTHPELAQVGLTESQAGADGREIRIGKFPFKASGRAKAIGDTAGLVKVIADAKTDRILGVHMVGPHVSELIGEAVLGVEFSAAAEDIARTVHAHPTLSEALKEAALDVADRAIHT
jgi:dihydrolipoamide dehydrogenase